MYLIFIVIAAMMYAVKEKLQHHYTKSIFYQLKPLWFWDPNEWDKSPRIFTYRFDARHITASIMIFLVITAAVLSQRKAFQLGFIKFWMLEVGLAGVLWVIVFNFFFNKVFEKK